VSRHSKVEPERACAAGRSSAQLSVEVSQPFSWWRTRRKSARFRAGWCRLTASTPIRPVTGRHSLPPPSSARIRLSLPCGRPASNRREYGFTVFRLSDSRAV